MTIEEWIYTGKKQGVFGTSQLKTRPAGGHAGLWFDRFGTVPAKMSGGRGPTPEHGPSSIDWAGSLWPHNPQTGGPVGNAQEIRGYNDRLTGLITAMKGECHKFALTKLSYFVSGVGIHNPIENGFAWHRILGTPYLPGSGVKGMVHTWAEDWAGANCDDLTRIFGQAPERLSDTGASLGSVIFLDAVPIVPPRLAVQVLTPHGSGSGVPKDMGLPIPIGFLAVQDVTFRFGLLPATSVAMRSPESDPATGRSPFDQSRADVHLVAGWLEEALGKMGAGARTKSGYGRFASPSGKASALKPSDSTS